MKIIEHKHDFHSFNSITNLNLLKHDRFHRRRSHNKSDRRHFSSLSANLHRLALATTVRNLFLLLPSTYAFTSSRFVIRAKS